MKIANLVWGMPLPRAFGNQRESMNPLTSDPAIGISTRRHAALPAGYMRAASRPVSRMNATTTNPTTTPMTRLRRIERLRVLAGRVCSGLTFSG